jgi:hypothetical protein
MRVAVLGPFIFPSVEAPLTSEVVVWSRIQKLRSIMGL